MRVYLCRVLFFGMSILPSLAWAQSNEEMVSEKLAYNELKVNLFSLIVPRSVDVTYERILKNSSSIGLSVYLGTDIIGDEIRMYTPYYRLFFGEKEKKALGTFVEISLSTAKMLDDSDSSTDMGIAIGKKLIRKDNWVVDLLLGISLRTYPRVGVSLGKRF